MICENLKPELIGYHLGALDLLARDAIDAHLVECRGCLGSYLQIKRALEDGQLPDELPSPAVRARIRSDVAALVAPRPVRRLRPAWLVGGAAAAAAIFVFAFELGAGRLHTLRSPQTTNQNAPLIDGEQADTSLRVL